MTEAPQPSETPLVDSVCEVTLETKDRPSLERFYTSALGLTVLSREGDRTWLTCGSAARRGLWTPGEKEVGDRGGRHVHFALSVTPGSIDLVCQRLRLLGSAFQGPVQHSGGDPSLYCEDPAGNVVELWDLFQTGRGATEGVDALASDGR